MTLQRFLTVTFAFTCRIFRSAGSLFAIRNDWPECCVDDDSRRKVVEAMRDECRKAGF